MPHTMQNQDAPAQNLIVQNKVTWLQKEVAANNQSSNAASRRQHNANTFRSLIARKGNNLHDPLNSLNEIPSDAHLINDIRRHLDGFTDYSRARAADRSTNPSFLEVQSDFVATVSQMTPVEQTTALSWSLDHLSRSWFLWTCIAEDLHQFQSVLELQESSYARSCMEKWDLWCLVEEVGQFYGDLEDVQKRSVKLKKNMQKIEKDFDAFKISTKTEQIKQNAELKEAASQLVKLEEANEQHNARNADLEATITKLQEDAAHSNTTIDNLEKGALANARLLAQLQQDNDALKTESTSLKAEKAALEENETTWTQEKTKLEEEKVALQQKKAILEQEKAAIEWMRETLEQEKAILVQEKEALAQELAAVKDERAANVEVEGEPVEGRELEAGDDGDAAGGQEDLEHDEGDRGSYSDVGNVDHLVAPSDNAGEGPVKKRSFFGW